LDLIDLAAIDAGRKWGYILAIAGVYAGRYWTTGAVAITSES
jgi:hypothetical protein